MYSIFIYTDPLRTLLVGCVLRCSWVVHNLPLMICTTVCLFVHSDCREGLVRQSSIAGHGPAVKGTVHRFRACSTIRMVGVEGALLHCMAVCVCTM